MQTSHTLEQILSTFIKFPQPTQKSSAYTDTRFSFHFNPPLIGGIGALQLNYLTWQGSMHALAANNNEFTVYKMWCVHPIMKLQHELFLQRSDIIELLRRANISNNLDL